MYQAFAWAVFGLLIANVESKAQLNVPRILLPVFDGASTSYVLEVAPYDGCYSWSTSRPDLIELTPENINDPYCSASVTVQVKTKELSRMNAVVLASNSEQDQMLRADIIIDVIDHLQIVTTTRQLYMEEPPEKFEVRAYDSLGNEFTSLKDIKFKWTIQGLTPPILRFISFRDSPYETPSSILNFDSVQDQGHIVLIEGVTAGSAEVSVKLEYPEYIHVPAVSVPLDVTVNFILQPLEAFIMIGDSVKFKVLQVKDKKLIDVSRAITSHYTLRSNDHDLIKIDQYTVKGISYGSAKIFLADHVYNQHSSAYPTAILTVCKPFHMNLIMNPVNSWSLIVNYSAMVSVELFTRDSQKIRIGPNSKVSIKFPEDIVKVEDEINNGFNVKISGKAPGKGIVLAVLENTTEYFHGIPEHRLSTEATINVYPKINLSPPVLYVPLGPSFSYVYKPTGGNGIFSWKTENSSVAMVSENGHLQVKEIGKTKVTATMSIDDSKSASAYVYVLNPVFMDILPTIHQVPVGTPIYIHISLKGFIESNTVKFDVCDHLPFHVDSEESFVYDSTLKIKPLVDDACTVLGIVGKKPGVSKIVVTYSFNGIELKASTVVSAFDHLTAEYPREGKPIVLAVGSSSPVVFRHGPLPNFGTQSININYNEELLSYEKVIQSNQFFVFTLTCVNLGQTSFTLGITSESELKFVQSTTVESSVTVICAQPAFFSLEASTPSTCPYSMNLKYCLLSSKCEFDLVMKDKNGYNFNNASSLLFDISVDKADYAVIEKKPLINTHVIQLYPDVIAPNGHYKTLITKNKTGIIEVTAQLLGLAKSLSYFSKSNTVYNKLEAVLPIKIEHKISTDTQIISLINRPNVKADIKIYNGSGYYNVSVQPAGAIDFLINGQTISVSPLQEGEMELIIKDKCIDATTSVRITIFELVKIKLAVLDKIVTDKLFTATVFFIGKENERLLLPGISMKGLPVHLSISSLDTVKFDRSENGIIDPLTGSVKFNLRSLNEGECTLFAKFLDMQSDPVTIQVFPPLTINPQSLVLCVGAEIQLSIAGGPLPRSRDNKYFVSDPNIVSVSNVGIVKGLHLGKTQVEVKLYDSLGETSSSDRITVTVIPLTGIQIVTPINTLLVGNAMPIWVSGEPSQLTALVIGSVNPPLHFHWTISIPSVLQLYSAYHDSNIKVDNSNLLSMRLKALKPGHSHIHVAVTGRNWDGTLFSFNSTKEVHVVSNLYWTQPSFMNSPFIIVTPNTKFTIKTNKEVESSVNYGIVNVVNKNMTSNKRKKTDTANELISRADFTSGTFQTHSEQGNSIIIASVNNHFINTQVMIRPVSYIMLHVTSKIGSSNSILEQLPEGLHLQLVVTFHDQYGTPFYAAASQLNARLNIIEKTTVSSFGKNGFEVTLEKEGSVVMRVFDVNEQFEDYIKLPIKNHIIPSKKILAMDDVVCFTTRGNLTGTWQSDSDILMIDRHGMAIAIRPGNALLSFTSSEKGARLTSYISVEVQPTESLKFGPLPADIITNSAKGSIYFIPVLFGTSNNAPLKYDPIKCNTKSGPKLKNTFKCDIRFNSLNPIFPINVVFKAEANFDINTGYYGCEITTLMDPSYNTSIIMANISIEAHYLTSDVPSESLFLHYVPNIYVSHRQLYFNVNDRYKMLYIAGVPEAINQLTFDVTDKFLFVIDERRYNIEGAYCEIRIAIDTYHWGPNKALEDHFLFITSRLTNQSIEVALLVDEYIVQDDKYGGSSSRDSLTLLPTENFAPLGIFVSVLLCMVSFSLWKLLKPFTPENPDWLPPEPNIMHAPTVSPGSLLDPPEESTYRNPNRLGYFPLGRSDLDSCRRNTRLSGSYNGSSPLFSKMPSPHSF